MNFLALLRPGVGWTLLATALVTGAAGCHTDGPAEGQPGSGGTGAAGGRDASVAPGTCGVVRRIPVPSHPSLAGQIWRAGDGFMVGPIDAADSTPTPIHWGSLAPDAPNGPKLTMYAAGAGTDRQTLAGFGVGPPDHLIEIALGAADPSSNGYFYDSVVLKNGETTPISTAGLLTSFQRGSSHRAAGPALDGQRGLFAVGHTSVIAPQIAVFGPEGTRMGEVARVTTTGAPGVWDCDSIQPTEHAGVFTLVDSEEAPATLRMVELTASGGVALTAGIPLRKVPFGTSGDPCPLVSLTPTGFAFLTFEAPAPPAASVAGDSGEAWHLHRIARDGTTTDEVWGTLPGLPIALAVGEDSAVAICRATDGATIVKRADGQDQSFPLAKEDAGSAIPSEVGTLFLTGNATTGAREIVEIACR